MKPSAIVYTSAAGHTQRYARLLGEAAGLPVYAPDEAPAGSAVIYLGWIHASHVKGYAKAAKRFAVCAVCAVGLCDTGTLTDEVRKATGIPAEIPLFTLQGGMERSSLKGVDRLMITMLQRALTAQPQHSAQDARMLELLGRDADYVSAENLAAVLRYVEENGYEIAGEIRERYIDGVWNRDSEDDWLSEIQVPVRKRE